jgi:hypothetical protein
MESRATAATLDMESSLVTGDDPDSVCRYLCGVVEVNLALHQEMGELHKRLSRIYHLASCRLLNLLDDS